MVEVPSAALGAQAFAPEVDFFSIGTNDLTQYTLAAERGNERVAGLADALHPSVLRLVYAVSEAAQAHGKWVGVCGELASEPLAVPVLVGLGVTELSVNPPAVPGIKSGAPGRLRRGTSLAREALRLGSAEEVRALLAGEVAEFALSEHTTREQRAGRLRLAAARHHLRAHPARSGRHGVDPPRPQSELGVHVRSSGLRPPRRRISSTVTWPAAGLKRRPWARFSIRLPTSCSSRAHSSPSSMSAGPLLGHDHHRPRGLDPRSPRRRRRRRDGVPAVDLGQAQNERAVRRDLARDPPLRRAARAAPSRRVGDDRGGRDHRHVRRRVPHASPRPFPKARANTA